MTRILDLGFVKDPESSLTGPEKSSKSTLKKIPPVIPRRSTRSFVGIRVAYLPRGQSHAVSVYATERGGLRLDTPVDWGPANLMASPCANRHL